MSNKLDLTLGAHTSSNACIWSIKDTIPDLIKMLKVTRDHHQTKGLTDWS